MLLSVTVQFQGTMRPKKRVLLISADDLQMSELRFLLETHRYRILSAETASEARRYCAGDYQPDAAILCMPFPKAESLVAELHALAPMTPFILISAKPLEVHSKLGACVNPGRSVSAAELLERLKVVSARKRGPRKGVARATLRQMEEATA